MPANSQLTPHELMEFNQLINNQVVKAKKTKASISMVQDEEVKNFMQDFINAKKDAVEQMENFMSNQQSSQ